jgi:hypothetical protein
MEEQQDYAMKYVVMPNSTLQTALQYHEELGE